jgi:hypothetical protein
MRRLREEKFQGMVTINSSEFYVFPFAVEKRKD